MSAMLPLRPIALPLDGIRLIEASAGTGKTWTIAALYVRAVLGHGVPEPLLPPQILVVTFTEAATQELRERIRSRLVEAARGFRGQIAADDFLTELMAQYPAERHPACARRLELAAQWMDEAAVFTIHGWSQRMLTQHAFGSGHPFAQTLEPDDSELLAECVRDYWRQAFYPLADMHIAAVLAEWQTPGGLLRSLRPLLSSGEAVLRVNGEPLLQTDDLHGLLEQRAQWQRDDDRRAASARAAWHENSEFIEAAIRKAVSGKALNANSYKPAKLDAELAAMRHWARTGDAGDIDPAKFGTARLTKATNKSGVTPSHPAFAAIDEWANAHGDKPVIRHAVLADALAWVRTRFEAQKRRRAQMGFDDLLTRLDHALGAGGGPALAETIRAQFPLALIDEFQDTDPLQYRIFRTIYAQAADAGRDASGLLLIGDPKQAIYAFRGADIHTYLSARAEAAPPHYSLDTNHRSTVGMVEAVNTLFAQGEKHAGGAFRFGDRDAGDNGGLPFVAVNAIGRKESFVVDGVEQKALTLWLLDDEAPVGVRQYRAQMAAACATEIVRLLELADDGRCGFQSGEGLTPLMPRDMAILVRSHAEAAEIRAALRERNVRSVFLSDRDSVFESVEAQDMLFWLRACAEPASDQRLRAALATGTLDLGYMELERLNVDERHWERRGREFHELRDIWRRQGVLAMLHRLLHLFDLPARLLATDGGERALTNLLHLAELMQEAAATLDGEQALIRHLGEQLDTGRSGASDEHIVRLESDADLVKVVTIHKAKGLEYPLVFLPFVCAFGKAAGGPGGYRYHDPETGAQIELLGSTAQEAGERVTYAKQEAELASLQEDLRLLYVALTRARHACWLGIAPLCVQKTRQPQLHKSAFGYLLTGGAEIDNGQIAGLLAALGATSTHIDAGYMPAPDEQVYRPRHAPAALGPARAHTAPAAERWWIASYSALQYADEEKAAVSSPDTASEDVLTEYADEARAVAEPRSNVASIHNFPRGAEPGTFLHGLFEWIAEEGFAHAATAPEALREVIARRCEPRGWEAWTDVLASWLPAFLTASIPLPDGSHMAMAQLADASRYRSELEFWFEATHVDTLALDRCVTTYTLDGVARLPLKPDQLNGMLKGFIDLVFEHEGRYYVADYKSNWLGEDVEAYGPETLRRSILDSRYDLQYAIYLLALHRQLRARLGESYDYDRHIGGAVYLYLRGVDGAGHGVHLERPPRELIEQMDALFAGKELAHAHG
jgi:exodeoxyribonuclease V beta subunit